MLHARKRIAAFLLTGNHLHLEANLFANPLTEGRPIPRLADGAGGNHSEALGLEPRRDLLKGVEGCERLLHRLGIKIAVAAH